MNLGVGPPAETAVKKAEAEPNSQSDELYQGSKSEPPTSVDSEAAREQEEEISDVVFFDESEVENNKMATAEVPKRSISGQSMDKMLSGKVAGVEIENQSTGVFRRIITGKVTEETGEPIPGVNVTIKGKDIGTVTDINGNYEIIRPKDATTLAFNYIGFESKELDISDSLSYANAVLEPSTIALNEVVVTGYGTQRKMDVTGAVSTIENTIPPQPAQGVNKFEKYLKKNLIYPEEGKKAQKEGTVEVLFYVETDGLLKQF